MNEWVVYTLGDDGFLHFEKKVACLRYDMYGIGEIVIHPVGIDDTGVGSVILWLEMSIQND